MHFVTSQVNSYKTQMFSHRGVKSELRQVVSWRELPGVLQAEAHCTGESLCGRGEVTKCTLCEPHWTVVDLETSDWKCPRGVRECSHHVSFQLSYSYLSCFLKYQACFQLMSPIAMHGKLVCTGEGDLGLMALWPRSVRILTKNMPAALVVTAMMTDKVTESMSRCGQVLYTLVNSP